MKRFLSIFVLCTGILLSASAQTFTQRLQQKQSAGMGNVTIHQSAEIDNLVNSAQLGNAVAAPRQSAEDAQGTVGVHHQPTPPVDDETAEAGPVGLTKKMMRGGVKVQGFRVQVFAGGNKRTDRQQAERISREIKMHYASVPVYVHFYSPRWICRVGNYRTYEEAYQMLTSLRRLGYNQATIVKGKITVAY